MLRGGIDDVDHDINRMHDVADDGICDDADVIIDVVVAIAITIAVAITVAVSIAIAVAIVFAIAIAIAIAVFVDDSMRGETDGVLQDQRRRIRHLVADM